MLPPLGSSLPTGEDLLVCPCPLHRWAVTQLNNWWASRSGHRPYCEIGLQAGVWWNPQVGQAEGFLVLNHWCHFETSVPRMESEWTSLLQCLMLLIPASALVCFKAQSSRWLMWGLEAGLSLWPLLTFFPPQGRDWWSEQSGLTCQGRMTGVATNVHMETRS